MAELDTNVRYIKGIGEKKAQSLAKLGVGTLFDLVSFFPRRYEDRSEYKPIALTLPGETVCIRAMGVNILDALLGVLLVWFLLPKYALTAYIAIIYFGECLNFALSYGRLLQVLKKAALSGGF